MQGLLPVKTVSMQSMSCWIEYFYSIFQNNKNTQRPIIIMCKQSESEVIAGSNQPDPEWMFTAPHPDSLFPPLVPRPSSLRPPDIPTPRVCWFSVDVGVLVWSRDRDWLAEVTLASSSLCHSPYSARPLCAVMSLISWILYCALLGLQPLPEFPVRLLFSVITLKCTQTGRGLLMFVSYIPCKLADNTGCSNRQPEGKEQQTVFTQALFQSL